MVQFTDPSIGMPKSWMNNSKLTAPHKLTNDRPTTQKIHNAYTIGA